MNEAGDYHLCVLPPPPHRPLPPDVSQPRKPRALGATLFAHNVYTQGDPCFGTRKDDQTFVGSGGGDCNKRIEEENDTRVLRNLFKSW